ncbi:MAG: HAD family hydrolase [Sphaerochaetaceae bacterium]|nr:HAD family hydrolase [Sphaerochaetaceae bacterium]
MKYKAICFDIDGTLYPKTFMTKAMARIIFYHPVVSKQYKSVRKLFRDNQERFEELGLSDMTFAQREAAMYMKVLGERKTKLAEARVKLDERYYSRLENEYKRLPGQPETIDTLKKIREKGLQTGIISDWPFFNKLEQMGVKELFDVILNCDDTGYLKPDKRCFETYLKKTGLKAEEVLYVGDSYRKDVLGATGAGMDAVLVNSSETDAKKVPKALAFFRDWKGFSKWLDENVLNAEENK